MSERPNPILKAAEASSNLPREARARLGLTTDPIPDGKVLDSAPELSSPIHPAKRDGEEHEDEKFTAEERANFEKEVSHSHGNRNTGNRGGSGLPHGEPSVLRKQLDSRHRGATSDSSK